MHHVSFYLAHCLEGSSRVRIKVAGGQGKAIEKALDENGENKNVMKKM